MVKRSLKNINKIVKVVNYQKDWDGRIGKVVDFRGDYDKGDPYVCVFVYSLGSVWSVPGHNLEVIGGPGTLTEVVRKKIKEATKKWQQWSIKQSGKTFNEIDWDTEPKMEDLKELLFLARRK